MIIRITHKLDGIVRYLLTGTKNDRDEKDHRRPIWGDLSLTNHAIKHLKKTRNYKKNYMHMTASFSESDEQHLMLLSDDEQFKQYQLLVTKILNAYFPHRDIEKDYMPYAELHAPTASHRYNSEGMRRLPHIHIVIPLLDLKTQNQLRAVPFSVPFNASVQSTICEDMRFEDPAYKALKKPSDKTQQYKPISKAGELSNNMAELIEQAQPTSESQLIRFIEQVPNISNVRIVSGKTGRYIKATTTVGKSTKRGGYQYINLRGERFPLVERLLNPSKVIPARREYAQPPTLLKTITDNRIIRDDIIHHSTQSFNEKAKNHQPSYREHVRRRQYLADLNQYVDELTRSQRQFYRVYRTNIDAELVEKANIWSDRTNNVTVITTPKMKIIDHGDVLTSSSESSDIHQIARLMLEIGLKKGWALESMSASGSDLFIEAFERLKGLKKESLTERMGNIDTIQSIELLPDKQQNSTVDSELGSIPVVPTSNNKPIPVPNNQNINKPSWKP